MVQWQEGLGGGVMAWDGTSRTEKTATEIWRRRREESNGRGCNGKEAMEADNGEEGSSAVVEVPVRRFPPGKIVASVAYSIDHIV